MKLETERLIITDFTVDMAKDIHVNSLDEDTRKFLPDEVFETEEEAMETIKFLMSQYGNYEEPQVHPIIRKYDGQNIGYIQVVPFEDNSWEIGYHVGKNYTCNGYASEAVKAFMPYMAEKIGFDAIYGVCLRDNSASVRVMDKCDFTDVYSGVGKYQGEEKEIVKKIYKFK